MSQMIKIVSRWDSETVLFECEAPEGLESGMHMRHALEKATASGANLSGANLSGANLSDAYLRGANLSGANLRDANLSGANLSGANLSGAYLRDANLSGANLRDANLSGANLSGANLSDANLRDANLRDGQKLVGDRPVLIIGPIGSRCDYLTVFITDQGAYLQAGCFFGSVAEFVGNLARTHGENNHAQEYKAALQLAECHAKLWTPKEAEAQGVELAAVEE